MPASPFNDAQIRHIVATLRHIDQLMVHAVQTGTEAGSSSRLPGALPAETETALSGMREELHSALRIWAPEDSLHPDQAHWALQTALRLALISIGELDAKHLEHYGRVDPAALDRLERTSDRLKAELENIRASLERN